MTDRERRNLVMTRPDTRKGQVESFFFKVTDPSGISDLWVKFTILVPTAPGAGPTASVWLTRIAANRPERCAAARRTLPLAQCSFDPERAGMTIGDASFGPGETHGRIADAFGNEMEWAVEFQADVEPLFLYRPWMYGGAIPRFKTATPYADARARGFFTLNGTRQEFHDAQAMQGHNWGDAHSDHYAWAHCNRFDDHTGSVFEGFSARTSLGPVKTPFLTMAALHHEGKTIRFDGMKTILTKDISINRQSWSFTLRNREYALTGMVIAHRHDFAGLMYPNPDMSHRLCVNSNLANVNMDLLDARTGDRITKFSGTRTAMLELIAPENWIDVPIYIPALEE